MSQWDDWLTTIELSGRLCEPYDFRVAHQALQKLSEREVDAFYSAVLDFKVLCEKRKFDHPSFEQWIAQRAEEAASDV